MHAVPPPGRLFGNHAVVIGASMSGLLAARVLASHFHRVTVFDRDELPAGVENRRGVPQGRHGHGLLASGFRGLKRLFPTLERELIDGGAVPGDVIGNVRWFQHGHYKAKFTSGLDGILLSRPFLETTIRRQVLQIPNVRIDSNTHVVSLVEDGGRVRGVRIRQGDGPVMRVGANFVVDASGRASRAPEWLAEMGFERPPVEEVGIDLHYTSRIYRRRSGDLNGDKGAILAPKPPYERRVGFMLAMEGDRWMVTMGGWLGTKAPVDHEGFVEFSRTLVRPDVYEVITRAEPLSEGVSYVFPSNLRRRYERLRRFPGDFLVLGDAMCSFNPLYGQGMSVVTLEALTLADCFSQATSATDVWKRFFRSAAHVVDTPWMIATGGDLAFDGVQGRRTLGVRLVNWYLARVHRAAATDRHVCRAFFDVANLLQPPTSLFKPSVMGRVFRECVALDSPLTIESDRSITTAHQMIETH